MLMGYFYFLLHMGASKTLQIKPFINYGFKFILKLVVILFFFICFLFLALPIKTDMPIQIDSGRLLQTFSLVKS